MAVVLTGGFGSRLKRVLSEVPKTMAPAAGRPFLDWLLRFLASQGLDRVVLSTGHLAHVVQRHIEATRVAGLEISLVKEDRPLGTAGGFLNAMRTISPSPRIWLVVNGDSLVLADFSAFVRRFADGDWAAALLGLNVADTSRYGTLTIGANDCLMSFNEKRPGAGVINAGVYLFRHEACADFPAKTPLSFEHDVFPGLLAAGSRILVHAVEAPFLDIGTPESLAQVGQFITRNHAWFAEHQNGRKPSAPAITS